MAIKAPLTTTYAQALHAFRENDFRTNSSLTLRLHQAYQNPHKPLEINLVFTNRLLPNIPVTLTYEDRFWLKARRPLVPEELFEVQNLNAALESVSILEAA